MASSNNQQPPGPWTGQQQMHHHCQIQNPISIGEISIGDMIVGIVDKGTYSKFITKIIPFLHWLHVNYPGWMTPYCLEQYESIILLKKHELLQSQQE